MSESWRSISANVIHENYQRIRKEQPDLSPKEVLKIVSRDFYPFGERAYFPYKAWLKAMKDYRTKLGLAQSKSNPIETPLFEIL